jgi:hypothetical protein
MMAVGRLLFLSTEEGLSRRRWIAFLGFRLGHLETSHFTNDLIVIMTILTLRSKLLKRKSIYSENA